ncbi:selenium metabolism-associated LysR family transcriptional regulator [Desulfosporosinus sp. BICA1-9]|uniref:selenium metabolism-associated LysR family transcriptional regulator n=1 Tax=Desulfosporosinus sp. BICA1-9 TaxID=1531958 RepID=UPI00054B4BDD|nr:selenium metabolism-associated LysR family transcriptional regulator [Desulfosporosinus sp. BICA1-9]KJS46763.1 MAG: LysR family transcriptional regulator [Peptococcaceae bacterium BRH_c23]KJS79730.1 MAG: LysR family transcriptional regulator [Desulfosporosinus sp. BICA1-9]HBW34522.1 LysR family transcriptional regulator [Desulfosporosinus sp.]
MDSNQLKIFCMVTRQQSFSKAAKLLHMSQPAVSTHVKNLEEFYQGQLFARTPQGVTLTKAGEVFYNYAQKILDLQDEMEQHIETVFKHENNQVVVGASTTIGNVSLPCSIYLFKEQYPEVELCLNIANAEEVLSMVMSDVVDIGVVEGDTESSTLKSLHVTSDELVLIVPPQHPVKDVISLQDFLKHPLIMREDGSGTRKILATALARHGYSVNQLNVITEMKNIYAIKSAVEAGLGGSVMPLLAVRKEAYTGTLKVLRIIDMDMPLIFNIVYPNNRPLTTKAKLFIKFLTNPEESCLC